jgi:hypothetical protein
MKIRDGFVSNSSSSSFIVSKKILTDEQLENIYNHIDYTIENKIESLCYDSLRKSLDEWMIVDVGDEIRLKTDLDNFDMGHFMEIIGVPMSGVIEEKTGRPIRE